MRHRNVTFSIPEDLKKSLYSHTSKGGISQFISNAIRKALDEEKMKKEQELDAAYEAANQDADRIDILRDWNSLDDVSDLDNGENWDWLRNSNEGGKKSKYG